VIIRTKLLQYLSICMCAVARDLSNLSMKVLIFTSFGALNLTVIHP
jgi:hypothetical protein